MIENKFVLMLVASGLVLLSLPKSGSGAQRPRDWPVREQETIQKTLSLTTAPMRVLVENVDGYVHVTTGSDSQVRMTAHKIIRAESETDLIQAKKEVKLNIFQEPGTVEIEYEAPGVCRNGRGDCQDHQQRRFYEVSYDIDLQIPRTAKPYVSTVNNGDVRVDGTTGDFEVKNVNGAIDLKNISGSGSVRTVNGQITVHFARSPRAETSFSTVNGDVDTYFPADISADLRFKTFNGGIYSDFDVAAVPVPDTQGERQGSRFVYRSNGLKGGRVGHGGPQITFNTLNGNIRLHRAGLSTSSN